MPQGHPLAVAQQASTQKDKSGAYLGFLPSISVQPHNAGSKR